MIVATVLLPVLLLSLSSLTGCDGVKYLGCYKDSFADRRLLPDGKLEDEAKMTNDLCKSYCKDNGFQYAGTQFEYQCFCSNRKPTYKARAPEDNCNTPCRGKKDEICGGGWRLSVYDTSDKPESQNLPNNYKGCYYDNVNNRALGGVKITSDLNSPDFCVGLCYHHGFRYAGVEWGKECFCGDRIPLKSVASSTDCKTPCQGDPSSKCGGDETLGIYSTGIQEVNDVDRVYLGCYVEPGANNRLMSGDTMSSPGTLTNPMCMEFCSKRGFRYAGTEYKIECFCSQTRPNVGNAAPEKECAGPCDGDPNDICGSDLRLSVYDTAGRGKNPIESLYIGCFTDSEQRTLKGARQDTNKLTPLLCVNFCQSKGFRVAGVQYGTECFCNNDIDMTKKVSDSECSSECSGDIQLKCGGNWRLSVYRSSGSQTSPGYQGCYTDEGFRSTLQGATIATQSMTPDFCIGYCLRRGFSYAGAEDGNECFCGDDLSNGRKVDDNQCQTKCTGDSSQTCGGKQRLSVFKTAVDSGTTKKCEPTATIVNGKTACGGEVVFQEDFRELNLQKWSHDLYMPNSPDYQFVAYQNNPQNIFTRSGKLFIKPTVFDDTFVTSGKLKIQQCTGQLSTIECEKQAAFYSILPPVRSARINTKDSFSFQYGKVEITAKLPAGDWIVPEIWLEPKRYSRYGQDYASGRVRLAMARGNLILRSGSADIGNRLLETGVVLGVESDIAALSAHWTSNERGGWSEKFHTYAFTWTPDDLVFSVDGKRPTSLLASGRKLKDTAKFKNKTTSQIWNSGSVIAPFDQEFYITIGLSVGGLRDFPDGSANGRDGTEKPWRNTDFKAMATFFQATNDWKNTWVDDRALLQIESVKVTAL